MLSDYLFKDSDVYDGAKFVCVYECDTWSKSINSIGVGSSVDISVSAHGHIRILTPLYSDKCGIDDIRSINRYYSLNDNGRVSLKNTSAFALFVPIRSVTDEERVLLALTGDCTKVLKL